jgi:hypothetical protein
MKRINTANRAIDLFGAGKDGFRASVPGVSEATFFSALWANHVQEALVRVREAAGLPVPADNDFDWFTTALSALIDAQSGNYALDTGTADAYVVALDPQIVAYGNGMTVRFRVANANTGASTLNAGGGTVSLRNAFDGELTAGDLPAGTIVAATYDSVLNRFLINSLVPSQVMTQAQADARYLSAESEAGSVKYFARSTAPTGYLKANGATISRTTYPALFNAIGTAFGAGDGSTTFKLPDLRGEFPRGWDDGRGLDSGRGFGTVQSAATEDHKHIGGAGVEVTVYGSAGGTTWRCNSTTSGSPLLPWSSGMYSTGGSANGGSETRPRNISLLACIKF